MPLDRVGFAEMGKVHYESMQFEELIQVRSAILTNIRDVIRWGYVHSDDPAKCEIGTQERSIVASDCHESFMRVIFGRLRAGRQMRLSPVEFFTTNYDTLIEDSLALQRVTYIDGFRGGAVGFWDSELIKNAGDQVDCADATLVKLHGSIDWTWTTDRRIVRRRISDPYPKDSEDLLIYPQASKYDLARREPFDTLFQRFRLSLNRSRPQVLFVCGYGFGDDHVDQEIEQALARDGGQLTLVAFAKGVAAKLERWRAAPFGERVYVVCEQGIWRGSYGPLCPPGENVVRSWWTFEGMTKFLEVPGVNE